MACGSISNKNPLKTLQQIELYKVTTRGGRYCASHQELRELAVRGVDAPGMHVLDVTPQSFAHLPGFPERMAQREAELAAMGAAAYTEYRTEGPARTRPPPEQEMQRGDFPA